MMTVPKDTLPIQLKEARISEEYVEQLRSRGVLQAEKKLMLAVLNEALNTYLKYLAARDHTGKKRFQEVEQWVLEEESEWPFSFENISESLGLNPSHFRHRLMQLKQVKPSQRLIQKSGGKYLRLERTAFRHKVSATGANGRSGRSVRQLVAQAR